MCHASSALCDKLITHSEESYPGCVCLTVSAVSTSILCKADLCEDLLKVKQKAAGTGSYDKMAGHQSCSIFCGIHGRDSFVTASQEVDVASVLSSLVTRNISELSMQPRCLHHLVYSALQKNIISYIGTTITCFPVFTLKHEGNKFCLTVFQTVRQKEKMS